MIRSGERFGAGHLADILTGTTTEVIRRQNHDGLKTFGVGADKPKAAWMGLTRKLFAAGALAGILDAPAIRVNSLHRQAVGRLAEGLVVEATAPDGTIEAVRVAGARGFAIGVQWHPEYWVESDATSARLFKAFGEAVQAYAATVRR